MHQPVQPLILPMRFEDVDEVHRIACAAFPSPWTRPMIAEDLARPFSYVRVLRPEMNEPIVAFVGCWLVTDELHVLNVATHPSVRRRGYARLLMHDALAHARARLATVATLEVRASNHGARRLYRELGFEDGGVRRGYYQDDGEDAIVMLKRIAQ